MMDNEFISLGTVSIERWLKQRTKHSVWKFIEKPPFAEDFERPSANFRQVAI